MLQEFHVDATEHVRAFQHSSVAQNSQEFLDILEEQTRPLHDLLSTAQLNETETTAKRDGVFLVVEVSSSHHLAWIFVEDGMVVRKRKGDELFVSVGDYDAKTRGNDSSRCVSSRSLLLL